MNYFRKTFLFLFLFSYLLSGGFLSAQDTPRKNPNISRDYQEFTSLGGISAGTGGNLFQEVSLTVSGEFRPPTGEKPGILVIQADIPPGWTIYSITQKKGGPLRTKIRLPKEIAPAGEVTTPPGTPKVKYEPEIWGKEFPVEYHEGKAQWRVPFVWAEGASPLPEITGSVEAQMCDKNSCMEPRKFPFTAKEREEAEIVPPGTEISSGASEIVESAFPAEIPEKPEEAKSLSGLLVILILAFLGGLILNLMPCVLPVIGPKLFSFAKQAHESRWRILQLNLMYTLGLMSVLWLLATLAKLRDIFFVVMKYLPGNVAAGMTAPENMGWGEHFTYPGFVIAMIALIFVMGLSFLGVWEIPIPGFVTGGKAGKMQKREGLAAAFFMGILTTILATPCVGPFLGPVFAYTLTQPILTVYLIFTFIGLGLAAPYLLVGVFPETVKWLPKPGEWMETLKEVLGFFFLGTVVYLFYILSPVYTVPTLALLVALWFGCWLIGKVSLSGASRESVMTAWMAAALVAGGVGFGMFTLFAPEPEGGGKIAWQAFSPERVMEERRAGRTVFIDFTANWCPTCKWNSRWVIETPEVAQFLRKHNITPILADWTERSPEIKAYINAMNRNSIPLIVIWKPGEKSPVILDGIITQAQLLEALR